MNFADWYTDLMDIYRVVPVKEGNLVHNERQLVSEHIACRIYQDSGGGPGFKRQAADVTQSFKLACHNHVDLRAGDELIITVGGKLGHFDEINRAFAGDPHHYYEPYGAVVPQLAHQQVDLQQMERIP